MLETWKLVQEVIIADVPELELATSASRSTQAVSFSVPRLLLARNLSLGAEVINMSEIFLKPILKLKQLKHTKTTRNKLYPTVLSWLEQDSLF